MLRRLRTAFLLLSVSSCALADPLVYAGRLQRLELQPRGAEGCPQPCPVMSPLPDGSVRVCITNDGGCQSSEFTASKVFAGKVGARRTISARIGEWGRTFVLTNTLVLVVENEGRTRWTHAVERDGQVLVRSAKLYSTPPVDVHPIGANETGLVPVEQVLEQITSSD